MSRGVTQLLRDKFLGTLVLYRIIEKLMGIMEKQKRIASRACSTHKYLDTITQNSD